MVEVEEIFGKCLWKGTKRVQNIDRKGTSPHVQLPKWWFSEESSDKVYLEVYPDAIIIYRLDFVRADKLKEVKE